MTRISAKVEHVGLCLSCKHVREVRTDRSAVFYQCQRAATDSAYPKYPRLPVLVCQGYDKKATPPDSSMS